MQRKMDRAARSLILVIVVVGILLIPVVGRAIAPSQGWPSGIQLSGTPPTIPIPEGGLNPDDHLPGQYPTLPHPANVPQARTSPQFIPRQQIVAVAPNNYDRRMATDIYGNPVHNDMIVVLHETVGSATSAINTFQNNYTNDDDQVSYHALIARDGTVIYLVPPEMRAYGAGNSVFDGPNGPETVRLDEVLPPSVNNFAYHASLESPSDGRGNGARHSGYTDAQYRSLAWLIGQTGIPATRITTHQAVDRSGSRRDPRSFDRQRFLTALNTYRP